MRKTLSTILIIAGVALILFPAAGSIYNDYMQKKMMSEFEESVVKSYGEANSALADLQSEPKLERQMTDVSVKDINSNNNSEIDIGSIIGIINIPKIEVNLPIKSGTTENVLLSAIGHMESTSMPGETGNAALAGHRSHSFSKFFNRLDEVEINDPIFIKTIDSELEYQVYEKKVVKPTDMSVLKSSGDESIITLITCHPLYSNKQRLIVHAKLIKSEPL